LQYIKLRHCKSPYCCVNWLGLEDAFRNSRFGGQWVPNFFYLLTVFRSIVQEIIYALFRRSRSRRLKRAVRILNTDLIFMFPCIMTQYTKMTNKMQLFRIIYYSLAALHVSSDIFAHHQEHLNFITVSDITYVCRCKPAGGQFY